MANTLNNILRDTTETYLNSIAPNAIPAPGDLEQALLDNINAAIKMENAMMSKGDTKIGIQRTLPPFVIAEILMRFHHIINVAMGGLDTDRSRDVLGTYQETGENQGLYSVNECDLRELIRAYHSSVNSREVDEVLLILKDRAPRRVRCENKNLVAVNNGIFDYETKGLMPFTPDMVFTSKSRVNYNPNVRNIVIHNNDDGTDWDIESWILDLFDGDDMMALLIWQMLGAIIRPNVSWNKAALFYSNTGNNGKGTLCELMRQLTGSGTYASVNLSDMGKDFMLEPLLSVSAIIADENDVGIYVDRAANFKTLVTNDMIQMDRKFKTPVNFRFRGFIVQCVNELPRFKDKSDSLYRRILVVPFSKCFTGQERKYIKNDYLHRIDVLEYVLYKVLNMDYYDLCEPAACKEALQEYKEYNDPVLQFVNETIQECVWEVLPLQFLYDLYKAWYKSNVGSVAPLSKNAFNNAIADHMRERGWQKTEQARPGNGMDAPELLIAEYNLTDWMNPLYKGDDKEKMCQPALRSRYNNCYVKD